MRGEEFPDRIRSPDYLQMSDKAAQEWSFGQWAFLIVACCATSLWRFFSTTQRLPYNVFFWGDVLVTLLAAICIFAFPRAFQDGEFARNAVSRMRFGVGIGPYVMAFTPILVAFCIISLELGFGNQQLLPYSPIQYEYGGRNYPYSASMWLTLWVPRIIDVLAVTYATILVVSIPKRKKRMIVTIAFFLTIALTTNLGVWFSTNAFGSAIWGPNSSKSSFAMVQLNQVLNLLCSIFLVLKFEKSFRPSLTYFGIAGILQGAYFMIVRAPTNWYGTGASLISTALCLFLLETQVVRRNVSLEEVEPEK